MESEPPALPTTHVKAPDLAKGAAKWDQNRDHAAAERGVLRESAARPTSVTALRKALARFQDRSERTEDVLRQVAWKLDHLHADVLALHERAGIWRQECGTPPPPASAPAPRRERARAPAKRRAAPKRRARRR